MDLKTFVPLLEREMNKPLPGRDIQVKMSSLTRIRELMDYSQPDDAILSSVLILLFPDSMNRISIILILRPEYDGVHAGQISLPGGKYESSDENLEFTALREAQEEVGVDISTIRIIGSLTELYIPPSNYIVSPYVGYIAEMPHFKGDPDEVQKIIVIELDELIREEAVVVKEFTVSSGLKVTAPCFEVKGNQIWGATAMILSEFKEIARRIIPEGSVK
jgi:8-oxo-dGTP pyrophosphatase MutT (NUDIX family)